jgi:hypothetical protein
MERILQREHLKSPGLFDSYDWERQAIFELATTKRLDFMSRWLIYRALATRKGY